MYTKKQPGYKKKKLLALLCPSTSSTTDALPPSRMSKSEVVLLPKINPIDLIGQESEAKLDLLA